LSYVFPPKENLKDECKETNTKVTESHSKEIKRKDNSKKFDSEYDGSLDKSKSNGDELPPLPGAVFVSNGDLLRGQPLQ